MILDLIGLMHGCVLCWELQEGINIHTCLHPGLWSIALQVILVVSESVQALVQRCLSFDITEEQTADILLCIQLPLERTRSLV